MDYVIRWAGRDEWDDAMSLVWKTFLRFDAPDCTPEGVQNFRNFITDERLKQAFLEGRYQMAVAMEGEAIVGVASLRSVNHLSLLFVEESHHKRGIGKAMMGALCEYLKNEVGERYLSLLASPYAVEFYKKLGFSQVKPKANPSGIPVVFMEKFF